MAYGPSVSPLPSPGSFPASAPFPAPSPSPYLGLTASQQTLLTAVPSLNQPPTTIGNPTALSLQVPTLLDMLGHATGGAVSSTNDPSQWTPEMAAQQTDRALARIAAVNPELAKSMQEQRTGQDTGGGFLDGLKKALGFVTGLPVIHQALDLLSRPAHIIPELLADKEGQSVWGNVAQALAGHSTTTMADVARKYGVTGPAASILGFIGDVAVDPLTYLTMGLGGLGRAAVTETAGRVTFEASLRAAGEEGVAVIDRAAEIGKYAGTLAEKRASALNDLWQGVMGKTSKFMEMQPGMDNAFTRLESGLMKVHPDAAGGVLSDALLGGDATIYNAAVDAADVGMKSFATSGWKNIGKGLSDGLGLPQEEMSAVISDMRKAGTFGDREAYNLAKQAAALKGGFRLRVGVPFSPIRWVSPSLTPAFLGEMDFQAGRRFFAGLSGETRLRKMVENGVAGATVDDLKTFWDGGNKALKLSNPAVYDKLSSGAAHLGGALYPASEQMGQITSHFTSSAKWLRGGGIGEHIAANFRRTVLGWGESVEAGVKTITEANAGSLLTDLRTRGVLAAPKAAEVAPRDFDIALNKLLDSAVPPSAEVGRVQSVADRAARFEPMNALMEYFPTTEAQQLGVEPFHAQILQELHTRASAEGWDTSTLNSAVADEEVAYNSALEAEKAIGSNPDTLLASRMVRHAMNQGRGIRERFATPLDLATGDLKTATFVNPAQLEEAYRGSHALVKDVTWETDAETTMHIGAEAPPGVHNPEYVSTGPTGFSGIGFTEQKPVEAAAESTLSVESKNRVQELLEPVSRKTRKAAVPLKNPLTVVDPKVLAKNPGLVPMAQHNQLVEEISAKVDGLMELVGAEDSPFTKKAIETLREARKGTVLSEEEKKALLAIGADPALLSPQAAETILTGGLDQELMKARLMTQVAQSMGFDGIVTAGEDNLRHVTAFIPEGGVAPVKMLSDAAPVYQAYHGFLHRNLTDEARQLLGDQGLNAEEKKLFGEPNRAVAEQKLQQVLRARGVEVSRIIESDPFKISSHYAQRVSRDVTDTAARHVSTTLLQQGLTHDPLMGGAVGHTVYNALPLTSDVDATLKRLDLKAYNYSRKMASVVTQTLPKVRAQAEVSARKVADINVRLAAQKDAIDESLGMLHTGRGEEAMAASAAMMDSRPRNIGDIRAEVGDAAREGEARVRAGKGPGPFADQTLDEVRTGTTKSGKPITIFKREMATDDGEAGGHISTYYATDETGKIVSRREVDAQGNAILHYSAPSVQGQGYGGALIDQHFGDLGLNSFPKLNQYFERMAGARSLGGNKVYSMSSSAVKANRGAAVRALPAYHDLQDAQRVLEKRTSRIEVLQSEVADSLAAYNRTVASFKSEASPIKAAFVQADKHTAGMVPVPIKGLESAWMPAYMAEEFARAAAPFRHLNDFQKPWRRFMGVWKTWATWAMPGFHVRNFQGAWFNNWLGGVTHEDYVFAARARKAIHAITHGVDSKWAGMEVPQDWLRAHGLVGPSARWQFGEAVTYEDLAKMTTDMGLNAAHGRAFAEARLGVEALETKAKREMTLERVPGVSVIGKPYIKAMRGAGTMTENLFRTAAFFKGLRTTGGEMMGARTFAMLRHGDYADLTDWEYGFVRDLLPFYKWMRTNIPYQIHQLFESPGKLAAVLHAKGSLWDLAGFNYDVEKNRLPTWETQGFNFPIPGISKKDAMQMMMFDLPMNDLFMGAHDFVSRMLPLVRPAFESYILGKSLYSGQSLTSKAVPVSGPIVDTVFNKFGLGHVFAAMGIGSYNTDGKYTIDEKMQNALGTFPAFSRFSNFIYDQPGREGLRASALLSGFLGVGSRPIGAKDYANEELAFYYDHVLPTMEQLKSLGYQLPTTSDFQSLYGGYDIALQKFGITPQAPTLAAA